MLLEQIQAKRSEIVSAPIQQGHLSLLILRAAPSFVILNGLSFGNLPLMMMNNGFLVTNVSVGHSRREKKGTHYDCSNIVFISSVHLAKEL